MIMRNKHIESNLDDLLQKEDLLGVVSATAAKRVIASQIPKLMKEKHLIKKSADSKQPFA